MSIARHLGFKSRLLDWTAGFWIALSFFTLNPFLNPFYVCIDDSLLAGLVLQIFKVRFVVHEIVFTEHCRAWSFS
ncbi:MAG: FRG domain-containing protein [Bacteroidales bacterium]|nr:FRG domain-containing protein [Bacteroidales bacterium]